MHRIILGFVLAASVTALAGCDQRDPYLRTDVWQPMGANAGNIAAMVADPRDLIAGRGDQEQNAGEPVLAVGHIWTDQPKPLLSGSSSGTGGGSAGSSSGGSGTGSITGGSTGSSGS